MRLDATAEASADAGVVARDDKHRGAMRFDGFFSVGRMRE